MTEVNLIKEWSKHHDAYATIDSNPQIEPTIIMCKGNHYIAEPMPDDLTEEDLDRMLEKFRAMFEEASG